MQISAEHQVRFGRDLRIEREKRGVALEEVARGTRFSVRHLQSLEADLFDELPGGVLRKGIVRGYCRHMGLDAELWLERFAESGGLEPEPDLAQFAENVHRARLESMPQVRRRWWGVLVLALALLVLALAVWHYVVQPRLTLRQHDPAPQQGAAPDPAT
ncbi:MAG: helix-turn-helix domain-containing protein [Janthinobacterium lividum]